MIAMAWKLLPYLLVVAFAIASQALVALLDLQGRGADAVFVAAILLTVVICIPMADGLWPGGRRDASTGAAGRPRS